MLVNIRLSMAVLKDWGSEIHLRMFVFMAVVVLAFFIDDCTAQRLVL